jgi:hypothetical protein
MLSPYSSMLYFQRIGIVIYSSIRRICLACFPCGPVCTSRWHLPPLSIEASNRRSRPSRHHPMLTESAFLTANDSSSVHVQDGASRVPGFLLSLASSTLIAGAPRLRGFGSDARIDVGGWHGCCVFFRATCRVRARPCLWWML